MNKCKFLIFLIGILNSLFHGRRLVGIDSIMSALGWQQYVPCWICGLVIQTFQLKRSAVNSLHTRTSFEGGKKTIPKLWNESGHHLK